MEKTMGKKVHRDVWLCAVLLIFCIAVLLQAMQISGQAAYLPVALSALMALCAVFIILKGLRLTRESGGKYAYPLTISNSRYAFLFMFFIFLYYLGFRYITYWIATPVFMICAQKFLKLKSWKVNLLITAIYMIVCYIVFVIVLHLPIYKIGILGEYFRYV